MGDNLNYLVYLSIILLYNLFEVGEAVRCYQCSSSEDLMGKDNCGAYKKFDKVAHIAIECNGEESHMPGSFCMKVTQQSPKGFIWDGRWRQVIRRCASIADTGVTGVCNWGVHDNGVYWQECYCSEDECNASMLSRFSNFLLSLICILEFYRRIYF
ncbi:UPAR/Ly6 domain-containing protein crok-like [Euwallacea fornicatus]|uniref:UPAR/Ly6 domain-containing protein crok-like n=1 Tax=Euwallacea fornicatus TaxID=995702 RepID=UPI00338D6559